MTAKLALKKLTASDLTLFEWQFRNLGVGNQKAINLNANVFVEQLFPAIDEATRNSDGKLPLDLWIYGPGGAGALNLQRKIIKGGAYKNWRLNGEFIVNPLEAPDRFNALSADDYVFFAFNGDVVPSNATAVFVARAITGDLGLHSICDSFGLSGRNTMVALDDAAISNIVTRAGLSGDHPLASLTLAEELKDASLGSAPAIRRLLRSGRTPQLSAAALRKAREAADEMGRQGEELVAQYLERQKISGQIFDYEWTSNSNAVAPFDFLIRTEIHASERVDVKSTGGPFNREFHVSLAELQEMADATSPYRIYRVYEVKDEGAKLRISNEMNLLAQSIILSTGGLPQGVTIDAVSISPAGVGFEGEMSLVRAAEEDSQ